MKSGFRLVSWWPPATTTLMVAPAGGQSHLDLEARLGPIRGHLQVLRILGALGLLALVIVVPVAMRWWGGVGFLASLLAVVLLAGLLTAVSYLASGKLELTRRQRLAFALPRLNPFAAPAAGEALLERAVNGAEPLAVARALMGPEEFFHWIRPLAYDVMQGNMPERGEELLKVVGRKLLNAMIAARPARVEANSPWCPRCGSEFGSAATVCPACEVPLEN